jgi:hypothetical protein
MRINSGVVRQIANDIRWTNRLVLAFVSIIAFAVCLRASDNPAALTAVQTKSAIEAGKRFKTRDDYASSSTSSWACRV